MCWNQTGTSSAQRAHRNFCRDHLYQPVKKSIKNILSQKCTSKNSLCNIHKKAIQNNNIPLGSSITLSHNKAADQIRTTPDKIRINLHGWSPKPWAESSTSRVGWLPDVAGLAGTTGCGWSSGCSSWSQMSQEVHMTALKSSSWGLADLPIRGTAAFRGKTPR